MPKALCQYVKFPQIILSASAILLTHYSDDEEQKIESKNGSLANCGIAQIVIRQHLPVKWYLASHRSVLWRIIKSERCIRTNICHHAVVRAVVRGKNTVLPMKRGYHKENKNDLMRLMKIKQCFCLQQLLFSALVRCKEAFLSVDLPVTVEYVPTRQKMHAEDVAPVHQVFVSSSISPTVNPESINEQSSNFWECINAQVTAGSYSGATRKFILTKNAACKRSKKSALQWRTSCVPVLCK